jgi:putative restriction endonuclease
VDAAHIHPFASSRNNDPRNGLALCKNAHWLFDRGLWTIGDDYRVQVARGHFFEQSPDGRALGAYEGQRLRLPAVEATWPAVAHLAWHRRHRFLHKAG